MTPPSNLAFERQLRHNPCSCAGRGFDRQRPAKEEGTLAHPGEAARGGACGPAIETPTSIFNLDGERVMVCQKMYGRLLDPCVPRNVGQGLLRNTEGSYFDLWRS
jgi:hypothetical protein